MYNFLDLHAHVVNNLVQPGAVSHQRVAGKAGWIVHDNLLSRNQRQPKATTRLFSGLSPTADRATEG
jgi:hypothetical protein